eukprot:5944720-Alexandrium_andersonii.AAC.1
MLPLLGRAGLDLVPFEGARSEAVRRGRATETDLRHMADQTITVLRPVARRVLVGTFGKDA